MGTSTPKGILLAHAQRYIRAVMANRLQQEGFVSKDGDDVHWYRIINGEVVHAIYFFTRHTQLPMFLNIGFGCHPLYISPVFPNGPYLYGMPGYEVIYPRYTLSKNSNKYCYAEDSLVSCPADEYQGLDILECVFPALEKAQTPLDCYRIHRGWREGQIANGSWIAMSTQFVDEVVYWDDKELYPYCAEYILKQTALLESAQQNAKLRKGHNFELEQLHVLKNAVIDGKREEHLALLEERKKQTIRLLKKHAGIQV